MKNLKATTISFSKTQANVKIHGGSGPTIWDEMVQREAKRRSEEGINWALYQPKKSKKKGLS